MAVMFLVIVLSIVMVLQPFAMSKDNQEYKFIFEKMVKLKDPEKKIQTELNFSNLEQENFIVNGFVDQKIVLDDDWKVHNNANYLRYLKNIISICQITQSIYRAAKPEGPFIKIFTTPKSGVCHFMQTYYKKWFYESLKKYSNAPHYEKCPLTPEKYIINNYPYNSDAFKKFYTPGFYRIESTLMHDDIIELDYNYYGRVEAKNPE